MATAPPSPPPTAPPHEEEDNDNQQPPTPQESFPSPPSPIEDVDQHQQFTNSNSPYSPPRTPVGEPENPDDREHQPPEDVKQEAPVRSPPSQIEDMDQHQQFASSNSPYSPPRTSVGEPENPVEREHPPLEDVKDEQESPVQASPPPQQKSLDRQQSPAPPSPPSLLQPPPPPTEPEHPPETLSPEHESPISKQSPSPPARGEDPEESPNYRENPSPKPNSDHESPSPSSPPLQQNPSPKAHESPKGPSPSPPPTAASPSPPPTAASPSPPLGVPILQAVASTSPTKPQTSPWTHQETANLIQAYQEKWYSLKKGPLKASQWEEVAITVAARCGYDEPTKTAKQCRHKIEKLRKRYRTERGKPRAKATAWNFFKLMDNLEKGPLPISSSQPSMELVEYQKPTNSNSKRRKNDDGDSELFVNKKSRSRSSNHHIPNGGLTRDLRFPDAGHDRVMRGLRTPVVHKRRGFYQDDDDDEDDDNNEEDEEGVASQLAAEIKGFAEKFVKLENKKIEMIKDVERYRLEMENKRMEMILESQQMLVETVNRAFVSSRKPHKLSAN